MILLADVLCAVSVALAPVGTDGPSGTAAVFTPDGQSLVYQCPRGDFFDLIRCDSAFGSVTTLVSTANGSFGQPAVAPDGSVAYVGYSFEKTAHRKGVEKSDDGANVWLLKDGVTRRLTWGWQFDATPSFGPDGMLYYASADLSTARGVSAIFRLDPNAANPKPEPLFYAPAYYSSSVSQPVVSPDGRFLVWAEMDGWDSTWTLRVSPLDDRTAPGVLTPPKMWAYAPRWCPDSRHLVFTGFQVGDESWSVYAVDLKTGALDRIVTGTEPVVSPDGRTLVYERGGTLRRMPFALPAERPSDSPWPWNEPERVLLARADVPNGTRIPLDETFRFGRDKTVFLRVRFAYDGNSKILQDLVRLAYVENDRGLDLYLGKGQPHFATRDALGGHFRIATGTVFKGKTGVMTAVRAREAIYLFVEGDSQFASVYTKGFSRGNLSLDTPRTLFVGENLPEASRVTSVEVGLGWPAGLPRPFDAREAFK